MKNRTNPCFRCEKRTATCRIECPDWQAYCEERDKDYELKANPEYVYKNYQFWLHNKFEKQKNWKKRH